MEWQKILQNYSGHPWAPHAKFSRESDTKNIFKTIYFFTNLKLFHSTLPEQNGFWDFIKSYTNHKIIKWKLEILDTYINLQIQFQNFVSSFDSTNNFVNVRFTGIVVFQCNNVCFENTYKIENEVKFNETKFSLLWQLLH